jgi:hypothetical protein
VEYFLLGVESRWSIPIAADAALDPRDGVTALERKQSTRSK